MSKELKPCPFCGGAKICTEKSINLNYCDNCSAESNVEHWNIRPIEDALHARIAELEGFIDRLVEAGELLAEYCEYETGKIAWDALMKDWKEREVKNILIDKNLHIDSLYEEGYKLQQRIAELEAAQRWIPVGERSPEDGEVVWVWDGNNLGMGYYLVLTKQFMDRDTPLRRIKPTHWMSLPTPPEVKE